MPFQWDAASGEYTYQGDTDPFGSPAGLTAASLLDDTMRKKQQDNLMEQAKAADDWIGKQYTPPTAGLAQATARGSGSDYYPGYASSATALPEGVTSTQGLVPTQTPTMQAPGAAVRPLPPESNQGGAFTPLPMAPADNSKSGFLFGRNDNPEAAGIATSASPFTVAGQALAIPSELAHVGTEAAGIHGFPQRVIENTAGLAPFAAAEVASGGGLTPALAARYATMGALGTLGSDADRRLGLPQLPVVGGPIGALGFALGPGAAERGLAGLNRVGPAVEGYAGRAFESGRGISSAIEGTGLPGIVPREATTAPMAVPRGTGEGVTPEETAAIKARADAVRSGEGRGFPQREPAPAASIPPVGDVAPPPSAPAGAAPAPFTNRADIPGDRPNPFPNVPGLVDAEQFGVTQAWASKMPNIPVDVATDAQVRQGLYNAGLESTDTGIKADSRLQDQNISNARDLYMEANRQGIRMPQEQPPSGMPDAADFTMRNAPQRQEAAAPSQSFNDYRDQNTGPRMVSDETRANWNPEKGTQSGTGSPGGRVPPNDATGTGNGGIGRPPPDATPRGTNAWNELKPVISLPIQPLLFGHTVIGRYLGSIFADNAAFRKAIVNFGSVIRDPATGPVLRDRVNNALETQLAPEHQPTSMYPSLAQPANQMATPLVTKATNFLGLTGNRLQGANSIFTDTLRKYEYLNMAKQMERIGTTDINAYKSTWAGASHATGHGFAGGQTPLQGSGIGISPAALAGRIQLPFDMIFGHGAPNPFSTGSRALAMRNLIGYGMAAAGVDAIGTALGGNVSTQLTNNFGTAGSFGKVAFGQTKDEGSGGYLPETKLFINFGLDINNNWGNPSAMAKALAGTFTGYARGQAGPTVDTGIDWLTGKDWKGNNYGNGTNMMDWLAGQPVDFSGLKGEARNAFIDRWAPIVGRNIYDAVTTPGGNVLAALPSVLAISSETSPLSAKAQFENTFKEKTGFAVTDMTGKGEIAALVRTDPELQKGYDAWQADRLTNKLTTDQATWDDQKAQALDALAKAIGPNGAHPDPATYRGAVSQLIANLAESRPAYTGPNTGPTGDAQQAYQGYFGAIKGAKDVNGKTDYAVQDKLSEAYLSSLTPAMRTRVEKELSYSADPTYGQLLQDRKVLQPYREFQTALNDGVWAQAVKEHPTWKVYDSPDDMIKKMTEAGLTQAAATRLLGPYFGILGAGEARYVTEHPEMAALLQKWGYAMPKGTAVGVR